MNFLVILQEILRTLTKTYLFFKSDRQKYLKNVITPWPK